MKEMNPNKSAGDGKEEENHQENIGEQLENNKNLPVDKVINDMNNTSGNVDSENINRMIREVEHNNLSEVISSPSKMEQLVSAMFTGMKRVLHCVSSNIISDVVSEQLTCISHSVVNDSDKQDTVDQSSSTVTEMPLYRGNNNDGLSSNTTSVPSMNDISDCPHLIVNENIMNELNKEVIDGVVSEGISNAIANVMYDMVLEVNESIDEENNESEICESTSFSNFTNIILQDIINEVMNEDVETIVGEVVNEELEGVEEKSLHGSEIKQEVKEVNSDNSDLISEIDLDSDEEGIIITENPQVGQGDMPSYEVLGDQQFEAKLLRIIAEEGNGDGSTDDSDITSSGNDADDEEDFEDEADEEIENVVEDAHIEEDVDITDETFDEGNIEEEKINEQALDVSKKVIVGVIESADYNASLDNNDCMEIEKVNKDTLKEIYESKENNGVVSNNSNKRHKKLFFDKIINGNEDSNESIIYYDQDIAKNRDNNKNILNYEINFDDSSSENGADNSVTTKDTVKEIYESKENNDVVCNNSRHKKLFDDKIINRNEDSKDSIQSYDQDIAKNKDNNKNILNYEINFDESSSENCSNDSGTEIDEEGIYGNSSIYDIPSGSKSNPEHENGKIAINKDKRTDNSRSSAINPIYLRKAEIARCVDYREIKIKANPMASYKPSWKVGTQLNIRKITPMTMNNNNKESKHKNETTSGIKKNKKRVFVEEEDEINNKRRKMDEQIEEKNYKNDKTKARISKKQKRDFIGEEGEEINNKKRKVE